MVRRLAITTLVLGIMLGAAATGASATTRFVPATTRLVSAAPRSQIAVVKVSGLIDPINADLLARAISDAERSQALVLVVQLNSTGGTVGMSRVDALVRAVRTATVPVTVWVGGSGRPRAYGPAYAVMQAAAFSGLGPGGRVGKFGAARESFDASSALARHVVDVAAPTLGDFIVDLDGRTLGPAGAPALKVSEVTSVGGQPRRELRKDVSVAFSQLTVFPRVLHSAASPDVAFVMLVIALSLAVFEFYTAGVGVAAATAAAFGLLAAYGLGVLPTRPWAVALIGVGVLGLAIDVQSGAPRVWTMIGILAAGVGGVFLFRGQSVAPWVLVLVGLLLVLFMVSGMPAMVRTRFSTPTIGREAMVGAEGTALSGVDPDGTVEINGAPWRARTNRATPIPLGAAVRVVGIDGLVLEVEPLTGGARDYRH